MKQVKKAVRATLCLRAPATALALILSFGSIVHADDLESRLDDLEQKVMLIEATMPEDSGCREVPRATLDAQGAAAAPAQLDDKTYAEWLRTSDPFAGGPDAE
jgi:hypothetical protein